MFFLCSCNWYINCSHSLILIGIPTQVVVLLLLFWGYECGFGLLLPVFKLIHTIIFVPVIFFSTICFLMQSCIFFIWNRITLHGRKKKFYKKKKRQVYKYCSPPFISPVRGVPVWLDCANGTGMWRGMEEMAGLGRCPKKRLPSSNYIPWLKTRICLAGIEAITV